MDIDTEAVDEVVLALLYLNLCDQNRAWKSFDWEAMNRLHEKCFIHNPVSRAKSVVLTDKRVGRDSQISEASDIHESRPTLVKHQHALLGR